MASEVCNYSKHVCLIVTVLLLLLCERIVCQPVLTTLRSKATLEETDGIITIEGKKAYTLQLFGENITNETALHFTPSQASCDVSAVSEVIIPSVWSADDNYAQFVVTLDGIPSDTLLYICLDRVHQGTAAWKAIRVHYKTSLLPLPLQIFFIGVLLLFSALFSGLNLGLMSLDPTTLRIIMKSGTKWQKRFAKVIFRVRNHGNYLLCTILLGNVAVNSTITILLDDLVSGGIAVFMATMCIVIFGEIIPQAICSRHGLFIGAITIWLTYTFMILTFPVAFPLSLVLNFILGKEIGAVYKREQLLELLHVTQEHHDIEKDEVAIISGVLGFRSKKVRDVMTKLEDVYCLSIDIVLDYETMKDIYNSGFSRIPVYEGTQQNMVGVLYARHLAFIDPEDKTSLSSVLQFYNHTLHFVYDDLPLDELLQNFSAGSHHMAVVQTIVTPPSKDPYHKIIGLITLEDLLEEILQREIMDETDQFGHSAHLPGHSALKSQTQQTQADMGDFLRSDVSILSSQQKLAALQFLSESVEAFSEKHVSRTVLKKLLQKDIAREVTQQEAESGELYLYKAGIPANYFILILEGCLEVNIGKEDLCFEVRSFNYYGHQVLIDAYNRVEAIYIPDFTLKPVTGCVVLIVTYNQYLAALTATTFEQERQTAGRGSLSLAPTAASDQDHFVNEWQKAKHKDKDSKDSKLATIAKVLHQKVRIRAAKPKSKRKASDKIQLLSLESADEGESTVVELGSVDPPSDLNSIVASSDNTAVEIPDHVGSDLPVWFAKKSEASGKPPVRTA